MAITNALLLRWANGYHEVVDQPSIDVNGRKEGFLQLGNVQSAEAAEVIAVALFEYLASEQVVTTLAILPTGSGDEPYGDFLKGDWITAPAYEGGTASQRVLGLTTAEDEDGNPVHVPELRGFSESEQDRIQRWLKRLANGALGGVSNAPAPSQSGIGVPQLVPVRWSELPPFSYPGPLATDESGFYYPVAATRIIRLGASLRVAGTTATVVELWINGVQETTLSVGGDGLGVSARDYTTVEVDITTGSAVQVRLTTAGTGAEDLLVQLSTGT